MFGQNCNSFLDFIFEIKFSLIYFIFQKRVMKNSFFVLLRYFLRIDNVLVRINDTRFYHEVNQFNQKLFKCLNDFLLIDRLEPII
jgi:hypothetical protein